MILYCVFCNHPSPARHDLTTRSGWPRRRGGWRGVMYLRGRRRPTRPIKNKGGDRGAGADQGGRLSRWSRARMTGWVLRWGHGACVACTGDMPVAWPILLASSEHLVVVHVASPPSIGAAPCWTRPITESQLCVLTSRPTSNHNSAIDTTSRSIHSSMSPPLTRDSSTV
jgi:hypothetical protein